MNVDMVEGHRCDLSHQMLTPVMGRTFRPVPLVDQGQHIPPRYPPPREQGRRPSATPGTGPTPCGAASRHSHMESRGFHSLQTGLRLFAPETKQGRQEEKKWGRFIAEKFTGTSKKNGSWVQVINCNK